MQSLEGQFDSCTEQLFEATVKLEQKEKAYSSAEGDVGGLARRALLIEEEVERSEEKAYSSAEGDVGGLARRA